MTNLVNPNIIESLVAHERDEHRHLGRYREETGIFYILHSVKCVETTPDLRDCKYSLALDKGMPKVKSTATQCLHIDFDGYLTAHSVV